ncbi:MAG: methyltransferase family protein [Candidatus Hodarchaeota archaeon]
MMDLTKKLMFFLIINVLYYNLFYLLIVPEIYSILIYQVFLVLYYGTVLIDTLLRPMSEKAEVDIYTKILLLLFLIQPFILIFSYFENKYFISEYIQFWNNDIIAYIGLVIYTLACLTIITSRYQIGKYGSGHLVIEDDHQLVQSGIYKYIRHPIYSGAILGMMAFGLVFRSMFIPGVGTLIYFFVFNQRLKQEEHLLVKQFGEEYLKYKKSSKKLIPFIY